MAQLNFGNMLKRFWIAITKNEAPAFTRASNQNDQCICKTNDRTLKYLMCYYYLRD